MKPWKTIETAYTPEGTPLVLQQRDDEFSIRLGGMVLMTSRSHGSEELLASAALEGKKGVERVLIGGLGMGYTLRAVLDRVGPMAQVVQAELVPQVVGWNRGPLAHLAGRPLDDKRVVIHSGFVQEAYAEPGSFDAILLDVDNGPNAMTSEKNAQLYSPRGLGRLHTGLRPKGRLTIWSAAPYPPFVNKLRDAGFRNCEMKQAGGRHVVFVGER